MLVGDVGNLCFKKYHFHVLGRIILHLGRLYYLARCIGHSSLQGRHNTNNLFKELVDIRRGEPVLLLLPVLLDSLHPQPVW